MAGAPCPIELCKRLVNDMHMSGFQILYGATETSPASFMSLLSETPEERIRSAGHVLEHVEVISIEKNSDLANK